MSAFDDALAHLYQLEGEGWDKHDPAGETYKGVVRGIWERWFRVRFADFEWPPNEEQLAEFYRVIFWPEYLPDEVAREYFKISTNTGHRAANIILQRALRADLREPIADDGVIGPQTRAAVARCRPDIVAAAFRSEAARHYDALRAANPARNERFWRGWINRAYS